jgi:hypothetical protein
VKSRGTFREDQTRSASTSRRTSNACLNNAETQEALQTHVAIMVSIQSTVSHVFITDNKKSERPLQLRPTPIQIDPLRPGLSHRQPRAQSRPPRPAHNLTILLRPHARRLPTLRRRRARPRQSDQRRRAHRQLPLRTARIQIPLRRAQARERAGRARRRSLGIARSQTPCEPDAREPILGCRDESERSGEFEPAVQDFESQLCCWAERREQLLGLPVAVRAGDRSDAREPCAAGAEFLWVGELDSG